MKIKIALLLTLCSLTSCEVKEHKVLGLDEIRYVESFPAQGSLNEISHFKCDAIGCQSVKVIDSLLVVGHSSNWSIYSTDGRKCYGTCLSVGQGPSEFRYVPRCAAACFVTENDSTVAYVADESKGRIMRFNLSGFIDNGAVENYPVIKSKALSSRTWDVTPCDSSSFLISQPNDDMTGFIRLIYENGIVRPIEATKDISFATVESSENINLLARVTRYNTQSGKFVEAMSYLNQINVFDKDNDNGITICHGKELDDLAQIESRPMPERMNAYISVSAFKQGFGAVYLGASEAEVYYGKVKDTRIQFFDWSGAPVYEAIIPFSVLTYDIDFDNKILYAINESEDKIVAFDASPIVAEYMKN